MTDELTTAADAHRAVADALRAKADGDESSVLRFLNNLDHPAAVYATCYLFSAICELLAAGVNHDPRRFELAFRNHAELVEQHLITNQVRLLSRDQ